MAGAGLGSLPHASLPVLAAAVARLPVGAAVVPRAWCVSLMHASRGPRLSRLPTQSLAQLVWALGRLGVTLRADYARELLSAAKSGMGSAGPRALATLAHGLGAARVRPDGIWAGVFAHALATQLPAFSPRDLAMVLWGLVQMRCVSAVCMCSSGSSVYCRQARIRV